MPLNLDSCIAGVFTPGNIGASSGLPPVAPTVPSFVGPAPALVEIASASETLDAFFGELLHEATSASDSYTARGGAYVLLVSETAAAVDAVRLAQTFDVAVGEVSGDTSDDVSVREPAIVDAILTEAAAATDTVATGNIHDVSISEAASATDAPGATVVSGVVAHSAMIAEQQSVFVTTSGTTRTAPVGAIMINE